MVELQELNQAKEVNQMNDSCAGWIMIMMQPEKEMPSLKYKGADDMRWAGIAGIEGRHSGIGKRHSWNDHFSMTNEII